MFADVLDEHPAIDRSVAALARDMAHDSGNPERNTRRYHALVITRIDGSRTEIVAASFVSS